VVHGDLVSGLAPQWQLGPFFCCQGALLVVVVPEGASIMHAVCVMLCKLISAAHKNSAPLICKPSPVAALHLCMLHQYTVHVCMCLPLPLQNARNVLVASEPGAALGMVAKVADLGLSQVIKHNSHHTTNTVGTMNHTAPGEPKTK
jgi:hypothetical protein